MKKNITLLIFLLFTSFSLVNARVYYVKSNGNDNLSGISWASAFATLEKGINMAQAGDEIWVATGDYTPQRAGSAYRMKSGVGIYGGFAGYETARSQRDWERNQTALYGNGSSVFLNDFEAMRPLSNAVLDGFILKGGTGSAINVTYPTTNYLGGAIHNIYASLIVANCLITQCSATTGGGIYNTNSSLILEKSTISECEAKTGGGIANVYSDLKLVKATIEKCSAYSGSGGGIVNGFNGNIDMTDSKLNYNKASSGGGGLLGVEENGTVRISNTTIQANHAREGAGISYNYQTNELYMENVLMTGNSAVTQGGAMLLKDVSVVEMTGMTIAGNHAGVRGGGIFNLTCPGQQIVYKMTNSIVWGNKSDEGDYRYDNITAYDNCGGATILYPLFYLQNCMVERCYEGSAWNSWLGHNMGGNLNRNPLFIDYRLAEMGAPTDAGDFHLQMGSPAINTGLNIAVVASYDLDGNPRIRESIVDMGAYESNYIPVTRIYVNEAQINLLENGTSWRTAYRTLSSALNQIHMSRERTWEIWVAKGVYHAGSQSYKMIRNVTIYGGFSGNETELEQRDWQNNETILTASQVPVILNDYSEGFKLDTTAVLDGFTVMKGESTFGGGGIYNKYASPVIRNCTIQHCYGYDGGGMYNTASDPVIYNTVFRMNNADNLGGAIYNTSNSKPVLVNVSIVNNNARMGGGGIYNGESSTLITINNLIACNHTYGDGGGILNEKAFCSLINATVTGNFAGRAAGIRNRYASGSTVMSVANSIVWGNHVWPENGLFLARQNILHDYQYSTCLMNVTYSFIEGTGSYWPSEFGTNLGHNIDGDPLFSDYQYVTSGYTDILGDYRLQFSSRAINAGDNIFNDYPYDLAGRNRILQGRIDMGAYEIRGIPPVDPTEQGIMGAGLRNMALRNAAALENWISENSPSQYNPYTDNRHVAAKGSLDVYPNPVMAGNKVKIDIAVPDQGAAGMSVEVYNLLGERISTHRFAGQSASVEMPRTSGTYFVKVRSGDGFVKTEKIVVM